MQYDHPLCCLLHSIDKISHDEGDFIGTTYLIDCDIFKFLFSNPISLFFVPIIHIKKILIPQIILMSIWKP